MRYIRRLNRVLWGVNIALAAVALCVAVALLTPDGSMDSTPTIMASPEVNHFSGDPEAGRQEQIDSQLVMQRDIFRLGRAGAVAERKNVEMAQPISPRPEAKRELSLRLLGTVVDETGASFAVLENLATKSQDIYRPGDVVADARIDSIEQNKVVVLSGGTRAILSLDLTNSVSVPQSVATSAPSPIRVDADPSQLVKVVSGTDRQINTRAPAASLNRAAAFLDRMELSGHTVDGKVDGLRVSGLGDSMMARLVGLKDGDVIHAINGQAVPNLRKASQVLRKARNLGSARLELSRGQENKSLTFRTGGW